MDHHYKYKNITISGLPGGGSTTLLRLLREELSLDGWRGFSGGEFMRQYALEHGSFAEQKGLHHERSGRNFNHRAQLYAAVDGAARVQFGTR